MHGNRFWGTWSKVGTLNSMLNIEIQNKYTDDYQAFVKAKVELGSKAACFNQCVGDPNIGAGLSSYEKNCMRECYFKRVGCKDEMLMMATQKLARENIRSMRDKFV